MATLKVDSSLNLRSGNRWKGIALLLVIAVVGTALFLLPALRKPAATKGFVNLPAMSNVPPAGSLHIEPASSTQ
jgi:hypothetical protein